MYLWQLILIQIITFAVIIIFLRFLFYQQLTKALKRLQELHRQNLDKEVALNKELERAKRAKEEEIEKGKEEARRLKENARGEVEKFKEQMLSKARQDAQALLTEAAGERELLKNQLVSRLEESSVNLAVGVIRETFSEESRQELQRELVDELIKELRKVDKEKLKVETKKAEVVSNYPLLDNQKNSIKEILQSAIGHPIELEEKIDTSIISGLIINLGGLILDGSLQNKLRKVIPYLRETGSMGINA